MSSERRRWKRYTPPRRRFNGGVLVFPTEHRDDALRIHLASIGCTCGEVNASAETEADGWGSIRLEHDDDCPVLRQVHRGQS
jgi:hypothetical protein